MRIDSRSPVQLECTMPNGSVVWLTYEQWQHSPANWTGGIVGHRATADTLRKVLAQTGEQGHSRTVSLQKSENSCKKGGEK